MGIIITEILIVIMLWLMSNAVCVLIGFFVACLIGSKSNDKKVTELKKEPISNEEDLKRKREALEYFNMMTYDGTPQQTIDIE